jgi:CRISPR/Cas system-associated exonuclease Cas4 (RecB family)
MLPTEGQRSGSRSAGEGLITGDMIAQFAYCPRRFHLAYVEGRWADNASTDAGRAIHARVDSSEAMLPDPAIVTHVEAKTLRGLTLRDEALGLMAGLDAVEIQRDVTSGSALAVPVETKSGRKPDVPDGAWPPERLQVMVQGLLLRVAGYRCDRGVVYYAASKTRVDVALDSELAGAHS